MSSPGEQPVESKRVLCGVLALLLGGIGVHKFVLGQIGAGIIMLLLACTGIPAIIGFIEGIIYLTKSDEEFIRIYQVEKKAWF
jgi:TM2 domain-containing membrane protein YozV